METSSGTLAINCASCGDVFLSVDQEKLFHSLTKNGGKCPSCGRTPNRIYAVGKKTNKKPKAKQEEIFDLN